MLKESSYCEIQDYSSQRLCLQHSPSDQTRLSRNCLQSEALLKQRFLPASFTAVRVLFQSESSPCLFLLPCSLSFTGVSPNKSLALILFWNLFLGRVLGIHSAGADSHWLVEADLVHGFPAPLSVTSCW